MFSQIKIRVKLLKEITSHCLYMHTWVLEYIVESKKLRGIEAKTSVVLVVKHPLSFIVPPELCAPEPSSLDPTTLMLATSKTKKKSVSTKNSSLYYKYYHIFFRRCPQIESCPGSFPKAYSQLVPFV